MSSFALKSYPKAADLFAEACLNVKWYWQATFGEYEGGIYAPIESFVTKVAVLDDTHYGAQHGDLYVRQKEGKRDGRTVNGLTFVRNAEIHSTVRQDLSPVGFIGVPGSPQSLRPRLVWLPVGELPLEYRRRPDGRLRATRRQLAAYEREVAGHTVLDTMMSALAFFLAMDPQIATETALTVFPLAGGVARSYERIDPRWPPYDEWAKEQLKALPCADSRQVCRRILDRGRVVGLAGYSASRDGLMNAWWETTASVARDLRRRYSYFVLTGGSRIELGLSDGRVVAPTGGRDSIATLPADSNDLDRLRAQRDLLLDKHLEDRRAT